MVDVDFLTNVETAFLTVFAANPLLVQYNWQRWDSDDQLEVPRGVIGLRSRRDPEETPYHRIDVSVRLEGRPKRQKLSVVMNELVKLLTNLSQDDLGTASGNKVVFLGKAIAVGQDRPITSGLRTWTLEFSVYAVPMV
jgi:hypothetical protein